MSTIIKKDADKQGASQKNKSATRNIIEDGQTVMDKKAPETANEKEASYKHENGNPQASTKGKIANKDGQQTDVMIDKPNEKIGSAG